MRAQGLSLCLSQHVGMYTLLPMEELYEFEKSFHKKSLMSQQIKRIYTMLLIFKASFFFLDSSLAFLSPILSMWFMYSDGLGSLFLGEMLIFVERKLLRKNGITFS